MPKAVTRHQYPTGPESVALARKDCQDFISQWSDSAAYVSVSDDLTLIASELVTNAIQHAPNNGPVSVVVERYGDTFRIEVRDEGCGNPEVRPSSETSERGRGLFLVEVMSSCWGVEKGVLGVTVWAEVRMK
ncbi:ATP-binding protein [Streptomyces sp. NPDC017991]|uniref:ATP-binding protein n=1 Tax=Streptomyces sp. NPDC017991 TaxID=3365026 RepID=UPI00378D3BE7